MKKALFVCILLPCFLLAESAEKQSLSLPPGVRMLATLKTKLDAANAKPGDVVQLEITANLRGPGGRIVLPQGAKLIGRVTTASARTKTDPTSTLAILVERAEWKTGAMSLHAVFATEQPKALRAVSSDTGFHRDVPQEMAGINENCMSGVIQKPTNWSDSGSSSAIAFPVDELEYKSHDVHGTIAIARERNVVLEAETKLNLVQTK